MKKEDKVLLNLGENILLFLTFWADSHFGPYFDFATILVHKNKKKINSILVPAVNPLTKNSYMADRALTCQVHPFK